MISRVKNKYKLRVSEKLLTHICPYCYIVSLLYLVYRLYDFDIIIKYYNNFLEENQNERWK